MATTKEKLAKLWKKSVSAARKKMAAKVGKDKAKKMSATSGKLNALAKKYYKYLREKYGLSERDLKEAKKVAKKRAKLTRKCSKKFDKKKRKAVKRCVNSKLCDDSSSSSSCSGGIGRLVKSITRSQRCYNNPLCPQPAAAGFTGLGGLGAAVNLL